MMKMVGYGEKRPRCAANCIFLNFKSMDKVSHENDIDYEYFSYF